MLEKTHSQPQFLAVCKGAPEVMETMLADVPAGYRASYRYFASQGARVVALGIKDITHLIQYQLDASHQQREITEAGLRFAGFLVVISPLKKDSKKALKILSKAGHHNVMITGDSPLTACHVALELKLINLPPLILAKRASIGSISGVLMGISGVLMGISGV